MGKDISVGELATTRQQDAVRLLVLLHVCGDRPAPSPPRPDSVAVILTESRVHALDFWLRNPDYLALELLELNEKSPNPHLVTEAHKLVDDDVRHFPTLRHLFGAYTELDGALNLLKCYGLAWDIRRPPALHNRRDIYLLKDGENLLLTRLSTHPELAWYLARAELVTLVAGKRRGRELKDYQKRLANYRDIRWGEMIEPVRELVLERLEAKQAVKA